jgi:hypothetical protein
MRIVVISVGWKCEEYLPALCRSIDEQMCYDDIEAFHVISIDGGFVGNCNDYRSKNRVVMQTGKRVGPLQNIYNTINLIKSDIDPDDVIALVDADDLLFSNAFQDVCGTYTANSKTLLTYGSYVNQSSSHFGKFNGAYQLGESVRLSPWKASHLKTFKKRLWDQIPIDHLQHEGKFFTAAADLAIMFPLMELAGFDRCRHIEAPLYIYNDRNPFSEHCIDRYFQKKTAGMIRSKKPLKPLGKI